MTTRPLLAAVIKKLSYKRPLIGGCIRLGLSALSWHQFSQNSQELIIFEILSLPNAVEIAEDIKERLTDSMTAKASSGNQAKMCKNVSLVLRWMCEIWDRHKKQVSCIS